jgi:hypothetical protein
MFPPTTMDGRARIPKASVHTTDAWTASKTAFAPPADAGATR